MTKKELNKQQSQVFVGLILSDAWLERSSPTSNARFGIQLTTKTPAFFERCLTVFSEWISESPRIVNKSYEGGTAHTQNTVKTFFHPVFTELYKHYYALINGSYIKVVPKVSYLKEVLTGEGLTFLLLGDGSRKSNKTRGYEIHTQGQGFEGAVRLCLALYELFDIKAWPTFDNHGKK